MLFSSDKNMKKFSLNKTTAAILNFLNNVLCSINVYILLLGPI